MHTMGMMKNLFIPPPQKENGAGWGLGTKILVFLWECYTHVHVIQVCWGQNM